MIATLAARGFMPARYIGVARFWLSLAVYISAFSLFPVAPSQAAGDGVLGWNSGVAGYYGSAYAACNAQWEWAGMNNGRSRLIGASDTDTWYIKKCNWTRFQYLCLQETTGPGGCGPQRRSTRAAQSKVSVTSDDHSSTSRSGST